MARLVRAAMRNRTNRREDRSDSGAGQDTIVSAFTTFQYGDEADAFLAGSDPTPGLLAVEPAGGSALHVYRRDADGTMKREEVPFLPWLIASRFEPWRALKPAPEVEELNGDQPLKFVVRFSSWNDYQEAVRAARESRETFYSVSSLVDQYLIASGRTLFKQMVFGDLRRMQLDLETIGLDPADPDGRIVIAAVRTPEGETLAFSGRSEEAILVDLSDAIRRIDPDVIEGHNIFNFDLPFLSTRAARWSVDLRWGRDNSLLRLGQRPQRVKVGPLSLSFKTAYVSGRHIIDTYQQIQRYDVGGRLTSYGLKPAIEALGLKRTERVFVPGEQIRDVWERDPQRLIEYALDDVRDVDALSRLALPTEFYQTQLLPRSLQQVATTGPGGKINDLMLRAYLERRESLPLPGASRDYPGGHAELIASGVFSPVVKCDVESLYPSLMLTEQISSSRDTLSVYLPMLRELTRRRLHAKAQSRTTSGEEQAVWEGLQGSFKVLINSFYGYLGFGGALFNDYQAATEVTLSGQRVIKSVVKRLRETNATPIEVDTDGVYFVPPPSVRSAAEELAYVADLATAMPAEIRLAHDGRYQAMLSLHLKNYALLGYDDQMILKGSALRSRRLEPFIREFLLDAARAFMQARRDDARTRYFALAEQIRNRALPIEQISQTVMIHDDTVESQTRLKRLLLRMTRPIHGGERITIYEREDGELALLDEYAGDENIPYLLKRLTDSAGRFEPLFDDTQSFASFFPAITAKTDLDAARSQESSTQLSMF